MTYKIAETNYYKLLTVPPNKIVRFFAAYLKQKLN